MLLPSPLYEGRLIQRYKRFLADVALGSGETVTAHCANPGSMMGVAAPGSRAWLSKSDNPKRKLAYSWELVEADGTLVAINTSNPNTLAAEAVAAGAIPELAGYPSLRREVRYGTNSRIDLLLEDDGRPPCYVEVKNVHLRRSGTLAEFPDSVTARGAKHLGELAAMVAAGARAVQLFVIQRADCDAVAPAADLDPTYAAAFAEACEAGVEALAVACRVTTRDVTVERPVPILPPRT